MARLDPEKLHVRLLSGTTATEPFTPRRYTLTHSDFTADLYLTVGPTYDRKQITGWYTRLMRDEVLAEWRDEAGELTLHVHCHVSGGLVVGTPGWRDEIFRRELPLVLEAFRFGERGLFDAHPALDQSPVLVHFHATQPSLNRVEHWGVVGDYRPPHLPGTRPGQ